jgi:uncharacterized protein with FMN-binding domain
MTQASGKPGSKKKTANRLMVLSSAAVMAVYAAGYSRTRGAAERLDAQMDERQPPRHGGQRAPLPAADLRAELRRTAPNSIPEAPSHQAPASLPAAVPPTPVASIKRAPKKPVGNGEIAPWIQETRSAPSAAPSDEVESAGAAVTKHAAQPVERPKPEVFGAPAPAAPTPAPAPVVATVAATPAVPATVWKDGTYLGWGTCRHGDIQVAVAIEGGRIASAKISQCLTRYSCSVIDEMLPDVPRLQKADVDFVSGATQSSYAFYYAVVDALNKAK